MQIQTVERSSIFTRLDFRSKLYMAVVITTLAFLWENPWMQFGLAGVVVAACLLAGVRWNYIRMVFSFLAPFYLILLLTHAFFNQAQVVRLLDLGSPDELQRIFTFPESWVLVGGGYATWEGLAYGVNVLFKALALTLVIPLAVFTTDVNTMVVSMVKAKIPYKLAFVFSSTLRFFPLLVSEFRTIIEAQRLRGLALEQMRLVQRVRVYARVAVPLILNAMVKSQQIEVVFQSKAFLGSSDRTYLHESELKKADYVLTAVFSVVLAAGLVAWAWAGVGRFVAF